MSIDENRQDFEPALWQPAAGIDLQQVWFAGAHSDIGGSYPNHSLGDHAAQWLAGEAETCGLVFEPHFVERLTPDHAGPQHNEYKGFYRAMRRQLIREVEPVLHVSVKRRWEDAAVDYTSQALQQLLERLGGDWGRVELVG